MTPFKLLMDLCGLSIREAADYLGVRLDTAKSWSADRRTCPESVLDDLRTLASRQATAAEQALAVLASHSTAPDEIELGYPVDDHEAKTLGWPCIGAWKGMAARFVAGSPVRVIMVPRGSTVATAAAIDARERAT